MALSLAIPWDPGVPHQIPHRWHAIEDFATDLARAMQREIVIVWGVEDSEPTHLLLLETTDGTWEAAYYTVDDLAHRMHALGMHYWATQRRQQRYQDVVQPRALGEETDRVGAGIDEVVSPVQPA